MEDVLEDHSESSDDDASLSAYRLMMTLLSLHRLMMMSALNARLISMYCGLSSLSMYIISHSTICNILRILEKEPH